MSIYLYIIYYQKKKEIEVECLPDKKYKGICLRTTKNSENFYKHLDFTEYEDLMILDKTPENIHKLEAKLPHPITTEFYSTYPDNQII